MGPGLLLAAAGLGGLLLYAKKKGSSSSSGAVSDAVAMQNLGEANKALYMETNPATLEQIALIMDNQAANASSTMAPKLTAAAEALRARAKVLRGGT